jgi:hypothetical protein
LAEEGIPCPFELTTPLPYDPQQDGLFASIMAHSLGNRHLRIEPQLGLSIRTLRMDMHRLPRLTFVGEKWNRMPLKRKTVGMSVSRLL